jgi:hypothetical protein
MHVAQATVNQSSSRSYSVVKKILPGVCPDAFGMGLAASSAYRNISATRFVVTRKPGEHERRSLIRRHTVLWSKHSFHIVHGEHARFHDEVHRHDLLGLLTVAKVKEDFVEQTRL